MVSGQDYSFAEMLKFSTDLMVGQYTDNIMGIVKDKNVYLYAAITALNLTKSVIETMASSSIHPGDYAVQITLYNNSIWDTFTGYYYMLNDKIRVLDERYEAQNRSVIGVETNRFFQTYLGIPVETGHANRNEILFN